MKRPAGLLLAGAALSAMVGMFTPTVAEAAIQEYRLYLTCNVNGTHKATMNLDWHKESGGSGGAPGIVVDWINYSTSAGFRADRLALSYRLPGASSDYHVSKAWGASESSYFDVKERFPSPQRDGMPGYGASGTEDVAFKMNVYVHSAGWTDCYGAKFSKRDSVPIG